MTGFKTNFLAGLLVGVMLAVFAPITAADLIAGLSLVSPPASAGTTAVTVHQNVIPQSVNRAAKADRLHPSPKVTGESRPKAKILEGCDPAFSPLSKGAASNFSSRCLA